MALKDKYTEDELETALRNYEAGQTGGYTGSYDDQLRDLYNKISDRKPFQYDIGSDAMYKQYKDKYTQLGNQAMRDTVAQGAALTGGYDNSYAQTAGQQTYNSYMDRLNDLVPDLQAAAYQQYRNEGSDMYDRFSLLSGLAADEYGKQRDSIADRRYADELDYQRQRDAVADQRYADELAYERQREQEDTAYKRQQQAYSTLYALMAATGYNPTAEELAQAGISDGEARAIIGSYIAGIQPDSTDMGYSVGYSGGGSSGGGSGFVPASSAPSWWNNMSTAERKALQSSLGISADGIWGAQTKAATEAAGYNGAGTGSSSGLPQPNANGNAGGYLGSIGYSDLPQPNESRGITRGSTQREAYQAWQNGEITYSEYQSILKALH